MTSDTSSLDVVQMGRGRDLVLLHSLLSDRTAFDRIAPRLAAERRVWLVNLPGFGASAPAGPGLEQIADRIAQQLPKLGMISVLMIDVAGKPATTTKAIKAIQRPREAGGTNSVMVE